MPYRIKGTLKLPVTSQPAAGVDIEFISRRNYSPLLMDLSSIIKTSPTGAYDVTLEYGEYAVVLYWGCNQPSHIGKLFVFSDTTVGLDLQTLLQQSDWQPATPEYIQQIQDWLAQSASAASQAVNSAAAAKASELAAEADRAEVASNKTIVVNAQADVTSKRNDVTAKAAQVAANTATVNEKTPLAVAAADTASQKAVSAATDAAAASNAATRAENAAAAITGAVVDGGKCNLSSGFYPAPVTVAGKKYSTVWYVQTGGTVGGVTYDAGDVLRYTTADNSYFKVDAVDTATAQINAHKVDPSAHAISTIIGLQDALNNKYGISDGVITKITTIAAPAGVANGLYYPVVVSGGVTFPQLNISIDTNSGTSTIPMNNCSFRGSVRSEGWTDRGTVVDGVFTIHQESERAILSVWGGTEVAGLFAFYVEARAFPLVIAHNSGVSIQTSATDISISGCVFSAGVSSPTGTKVKELVNFNKGTGRYYNNKRISNQTAADVGADPAGAAAQAITALKAELNPFPQYSDFVSGEPRTFASRAQLAKRATQYHPLDGQLVPRSGDAGLLAAIIAGDVPSCPDADWLADKSKRGMYTLGDGSTNIRLPDWNGKSTDSLGAPVIRGDGKNADAAGLIQGDCIRNITGSVQIAASGKFSVGTEFGGGAIEVGVEQQVISGAAGLTKAAQSSGFKFDASRIVPTGAENRMVNTAGVHAVKR